MKKYITKINKLCLLMLLSMLSPLLVQAEVIYNSSSVTLTQTTNGYQSYNLDLNGDATVDFIVTVSDGPQTFPQGSFDGQAVIITPAVANAGNNVLIDGTIYQYASALNSGDVIQSSSTTWNDELGVLAADGTVNVGVLVPVQGGAFVNTTTKYVGLQFMDGGNTYYGYLGISVTGYNSFTIRDYAYDNTPDQSITAGQMPTGISTYLAETTVVKNLGYVIELEFAKPFEGNVDVRSVSGQVVKSVKVNGKSCVIEKSTMPSGIYNLILSSKEGIAAKKVIVQ